MATGLTIEVRVDAAQQALARIGAGLNPDVLLRLIGQRHLAWIDENFRRGGAESPWVPLRPNTLAGRRTGRGPGGPQPLRDTGRLAQSFVAAGVRLDTAAGTVAVGSPDPRAQWHHAGTGPYDILPRQAKVLRFLTTEGPVFRRRVSHPGLHARPLLPSDGLARSLAMGVLDAYVATLVADAERGR